MSDRFTETTTTGYGSRILNSVNGIIIGAILFLASFCVLYWNEGRADFAKIARTAVEISAAKLNTDARLNGKLISVTGTVNTEQKLGDNLFLKPDSFIALNRRVEMYSWVEKVEEHTEKNIGGSETTTKTYVYSKDWVEHPSQSREFKHPEEHENPQKKLESYDARVTHATLGVYSFDPQSVTLPIFSPLSINSQNIMLKKDIILVSDRYLFMSAEMAGGTFENPRIGDVRICYSGIRSGFTGTLFGALNGSNIAAYVDQSDNQFYRLFVGARAQGISTLRTEHSVWLWLFRLIGFLMMFFGLMLIFEPLSVLLDILPIFGALSRFLVGVIVLLVAFVLSVVTILVSMLLHSVLALIITLGIALAALIIFLVVFKKRQI